MIGCRLFDQTRQVPFRFSEIWSRPAANNQESVRKIAKTARLIFFALAALTIEALVALPLLILRIFVRLVNGKEELLQRREVALRALESSRAFLAGDHLPYQHHRYEQRVYRQQQVLDGLDCLILARQFRNNGLANRIENRLAKIQRKIEAEINGVG